MAGNYKTSLRAYAAWNYQKEIEDLNEESQQGWQLVKGGCFHSRFVKNPGIQYRYQLDYRKIEDMGRYIETFREQGWEYVNSTFNGWHYFRKLYDPALPEETYEIFTDKESLHEMNNRWARLAMAIGIALALFAAVWLIRMITRPHFPVLTGLLIFVVESALLIRGALIMRNPDASRSRKGDSRLLIVFFLVIIFGNLLVLVLEDNRPNLTTQQNTESVSEPVVDNRWLDFSVKYPDFYYLDLQMKAKAPLTFEILGEDGEAVYSESGTEFKGEDIRLWLPRGQYWLSLSCEDGYSLDFSIE